MRASADATQDGTDSTVWDEKRGTVPTDLLAVLEHGDPLDAERGDPEDELVETREGDVPTWMWQTGKGGWSRPRQVKQDGGGSHRLTR